MDEMLADAEISAESRSVLESEKRAILKLADQGEDAHWQIGVHYNRIVDDELAEKAGFRDAHSFFASEIKKLSQAMLSLDGRVAKAFPQQSALKYGVSNLGHLLAYGSLSQATIPTDPGDFEVQIPQEDGSVAPKKFADCSRSELQQAVAHLKKPDSSLSADELEFGKHVQESVERALGEHTPAVVRIRPGSKEPEICVDHIPFSQVEILGRALVDLSAPVGLAKANNAALELGQSARHKWNSFKKMFRAGSERS